MAQPNIDPNLEAQLVDINGTSHLVLILPNVVKDKVLSKSEKTIRVASTGGSRVTACMADGQPVSINVNAYIPNK